MNLLYANDKPGAYPDSYYAATVQPLPKQPVLQGDHTADVVVIGAGYTGLSAALHLAERGYSVSILEAQRIGFGASGRNGGQVSGGQRVDQDTLEKMLGIDKARALWDLGQNSVQLVHDLARKHKIDLEWTPGVIHADHRARFVAHTHAYVDKLRKQYQYDRVDPLDAKQIQDLVGSPAYFGGMIDHGGGHLHPLKYASGLGQACLAAGVQIYEQSAVSAIKPGKKVQVKTAQGCVTADYAVIGCNGYVGGLNRTVARKIMPINNFIVATPPLDPALGLMRGDHAVADSRFVINYFRLARDGRLLFGGGETYGYKFPRDIRAVVRKPLEQVFPQLAGIALDYAWGGTLGITVNRMPHFERQGGNILSLSGFSGHGVAMATLAGQIAAQTVAGRAERFDLMQSVPSPAFPGGPALRLPLLALAMFWFSLRDKF